MSEIDLLIDGYWRWLRDKTAIKQLKDWTEITTPYLDRHNDYLQIYAPQDRQRLRPDRWSAKRCSILSSRDA